MDKSCADSPLASKLLLGCDDPSPVIVTNPGGSSTILLIGDHAGRQIPGRLRNLDLTPEALDLHIARDIGVGGLGERLARALGAVFIAQAYSRLVIDCNRAPGAADSVPEISDGVPIPGNHALSSLDVAARRDEIYAPYHAAIAAELDAREVRAERSVLVSLHSFTPVLRGRARPWQVGVLHGNDSPFSTRMLALLREALGAEAGDNEPYAMDGTDNTVPLHAGARGLDYLELEVRQDLIADAPGQDEMAALIGGLLRGALGD